MKSIKIKNEKLFVWFYKKNAVWDKNEIIPTQKGKRQFYENQSLGKHSIHSEYIDPYFLVLFRGKQCFDLMTREHQQLYVSNEWWGFYQLWVDWKGDRWVLPKLLKWYPNLPKWITNENLSEEEIIKLT